MFFEFKIRNKKEEKRRGSFKFLGPTFFILLILITIFFIYDRTPSESIPSFYEEIKEEGDPVDQRAEVLESVNSQPISSRPNLINGLLEVTFTDILSGQAWLDEEKTDLYFDWTSASLFFPPSLKVQELPSNQVQGIVAQFFDVNKKEEKANSQDLVKILFPENDFKQIAVLENKEIIYLGLAQDNSFEIWEYNSQSKEKEMIFSQGTECPGYLALYLRKNGELFIFWASRYSLAYQINPEGLIQDLSDAFGWRLASNNPVFVNEYNGFIYIFNQKNGSIIRYNDQVSARLDQEFWFNYQPEFLGMEKNFLLVQVPGGDKKVYQIDDHGFDLRKKRQVVSEKVNFDVRSVGAAQIIKIDGSFEESRAQYFLSNDGGNSWQEAQPGQIVIFEDQSRANDLRWKIVIDPEKDVAPQTPYINSIGLKYWYRR
ncbi:hypothetical protein K9K85_01740 [Patescibacteria group bacterium]|nr:hypothetical protein [Patescibacteria group bacterium]